MAVFVSAAFSSSVAQTTLVDGVSVNDVKMEHSGNYFSVDMEMDISDLSVSANRAVLLTPCIVNGNDSVVLPSVGVYGRRRYYYYVRNGESLLSSKDDESYKASQKPNMKEYHEVYPYEEWMNGSLLRLYRSDYGCCETLLGEQVGDLGRYAEFVPVWLYVRPQPGKDTLSLEGSAYVDFPVDQTVIYPEYRRNTSELLKIQASIDSVKSEKNINITSVWLKGYASPESPYSHNRQLAIDRTAALKEYIQNLYNFPVGVMSTEYVPEDWDGLRRYVGDSNLEHRVEIMELIDNGASDPDEKEALIKKTYPAEYKFMLDNFYPALRHTDYRISYVYTDGFNAEEIKRALAAEPNKLSLNELYFVAQEYEPGTEEFIHIFETAAELYPGSEPANLNTGVAAMERGDLTSARRYLDKAGDSGEALYARGVLCAMDKDYAGARQYFARASENGVSEAGGALEQLERCSGQ